MLGKYRQGKNKLYILKKEDIDIEAENILREYCPNCLDEPKEVNIEKLIEDMGLILSYACISKNSEVLGAFVFNEGIIPTFNDGQEYQKKYSAKTIIIDTKIAEEDDPRLRFTYGHELGHYVTQFDIYHINEHQYFLDLFNDYKEVDNAVICKRETVLNFNTKNKLETKEDWQEWQANYFSSCILIPKSTLKMLLKPYIDNYDVMDSNNVLDKLERTELKKLINKLSSIYNVSKEMMVNRLKSLGYLK